MGTLDGKRDWGHVEAMWLMSQSDEPEDLVTATGEVHGVCELVEKSFMLIGKKTVVWEGKSENEEGRRRDRLRSRDCGSALPPTD